MDADGQRMLKLSIGEKLHRLFILEQARLDEETGFHHRIFREAIEVSHVDDDKASSKRGTKPPFRKASLKRHLTSLKARFGSSPGTGILTLVAFAGCFAVARSNASPHSFGLFSRSFRRAQLI
jgi:hypothetical protein